MDASEKKLGTNRFLFIYYLLFGIGGISHGVAVQGLQCWADLPAVGRQLLRLVVEDLLNLGHDLVVELRQELERLKVLF